MTLKGDQISEETVEECRKAMKKAPAIRKAEKRIIEAALNWRKFRYQMDIERLEEAVRAYEKWVGEEKGD